MEQSAFQRGYDEGLRNANEALLQQFLPLDVLIPGVTPEEAMAAGVAALRGRGYPILFPPEVYEQIDQAIRHRLPYSFVRFGDGELLTLAQEKVLSIHEVERAGTFLSKAGVTVPDLEARDELLHSLRAASLIGVPMSRLPYFQPLLLQILRTYDIDLGSLRLTTSTMNYSLDDQGYMMKLLEGRKILLVGNAALPLSEVLRARGVHIAGVITPVRGFKDAARVTREAAAVEFDLALVAAGVAAVSICTRLAALTGKAAIDFGSLANRMAGVSSDTGFPHGTSIPTAR
ncbi:hypothetical protein GE107_15090 [Cohnella sp. CFH 77786]|uniref:GT-D fold domain-containing protein n=1 Tax=Cohnella sp. CFH 77786 TaxID=2662265 RepID=UPI001C6105A6|nr:GT-D fold domain-containing glycosyltransferase [Cohnella sp. CFH 77786]MBW5447381.1 hypothetical protein [Cohnella sp. CFH 77786]